MRVAKKYPGVDYWVYDWQTDRMTERKYQINADNTFYKQQCAIPPHPTPPPSSLFAPPSPAAQPSPVLSVPSSLQRATPAQPSPAPSSLFPLSCSARPPHGPAQPSSVLSAPSFLQCETPLHIHPTSNPHARAHSHLRSPVRRICRYCGCAYSLRDSNLWRVEQGEEPIKIGGDCEERPAVGMAVGVEVGLAVGVEVGLAVGSAARWVQPWGVAAGFAAGSAGSASIAGRNG